MVRQSRSGRRFAERKLFVSTHRYAVVPRFAPDDLLVHDVPLTPPLPSAQLTQDQEGGVFQDCHGQLNDCPGLGEIFSPDRGATKPWPPQFPEDVKDEQ